MAEPRLQRRRRRRPRQDAGTPLLAAGVLPLSLYNGYFGAGAGVMMLTLLLLLEDPDLPRANALKNMLVGAASLVSAAIFACSGSTTWPAVVPLAAGMLAGSACGPRVARRLSPVLLRRLIAALGVALAVQLALTAS